MAVDQFVRSVGVSVAAQKEGGALVQPMVATRGGATSGASPGGVGGNAAEGRIESRERESLQNLSERLCFARWTGPCVTLANASACNSVGSVFPNCMALGGALGACVSVDAKERAVADNPWPLLVLRHCSQRA